MFVKCPKCETPYTYDSISNNLVLASDGSYIYANAKCPSCKTSTEVVYNFFDVVSNE